MKPTDLNVGYTRLNSMLVLGWLVWHLRAVDKMTFIVVDKSEACLSSGRDEDHLPSRLGTRTRDEQRQLEQYGVYAIYCIHGFETSCEVYLQIAQLLSSFVYSILVPALHL